MTYAPPTLIELQQYLREPTGLKPGNLGIVGDAAHRAAGYSYHLGKDDLRAGVYSRRTARDKAGLTDAASALDIGNHKDLRNLSLWLVEQAQASAPGTEDIREIIYSPDGKVVKRWDRQRGAASEPKTGEADDSHLWHTHVSWYRDSEARDKVGVFRPYYEPEAAVRNFNMVLDADGRLITGTATYREADPPDGAKYLRLKDGELQPYPATLVRPVVKARLTEPIVAGKPDTDDWTLGWVGGKQDAFFLLDRNIVFTPDPAVDCAPLIAAAVVADRGKAFVSYKP